MIFIAILFIFNILIIILLANVKRPKFPDVFKYKIYPTMRMDNNEFSLHDIEIDKHHPIFEIDRIEEREND